jgi:hypothetical protein
VREAVLELTYTADDMGTFARDMGYVDAKRKVKQPFKWDEARRLMLRAKLDAIYCHLYGITNPTTYAISIPPSRSSGARKQKLTGAISRVTSALRG